MFKKQSNEYNVDSTEFPIFKETNLKITGKSIL